MKIKEAIEQALNCIDHDQAAKDKRAMLNNWIMKYGFDATCLATGLKPSTVMQYARDQGAIIGTDAIEQGKFVFSHPIVVQAFTEKN